MAKIIKKAQNGVTKKLVNTKPSDKTFVKKLDAVKVMKGDNEMAVRKQDALSRLADQTTWPGWKDTNGIGLYNR